MPTLGTNVKRSLNLPCQDMLKSNARSPFIAGWSTGKRQSDTPALLPPLQICDGCAPRASSWACVNSPAPTRACPAGVSMFGAAVLKAVIRELSWPTDVPRPNAPTLVPGSRSPTVPSPLKSEKKISAVLALTPPAAVGTWIEVGKALQKWEMNPRRKRAGRSKYPPKFNWWVRSSVEGPLSPFGFRLSNAPITKSWSELPGTVGFAPPEFVNRDSV